MEKEDFIRAIHSEGFTVIRNLLPEKIVKPLREAVLDKTKYEIRQRGKNPPIDYGRILFCPVYGGIFLSLLNYDPLFEPVEWILGPDCILYTMSSSSIPPNETIGSSMPHQDTKIFIPGYITTMGILIILDDFNPETGATVFYPGSQHLQSLPPDFPRKQLSGSPGDVCYFDARTWHQGGSNTTSRWRCSLLIGIVRHWMKQRFDIRKILEHTDLSTLNENGRTRLGLTSLPPGSYEEYYGRAGY